MGYGKGKNSNDTNAFETFVESLTVEFPQLDESLIRAIVSDHNSLEPTDEKNVKELLRQLADGALESWVEPDIAPASSEEPAMAIETSYTEGTTSSSSSCEPSEEQLLAELQLIFPNQPVEHLQQILQECSNDFNRALDVLINEDFLASEQSASGTCIPNRGKKNRRQRGKKKSGNNSYSESLIDSLAIVPQYKPMKLDDEEEWAPKPTANSSSTSWQSAAEHASVAQEDFAKAAHYARLGRSNPLFNSAAAFYSTSARQALDAAKTARSEEADARVARTATQNPKQIDLHGVTTADAKRIALERTRIWWEQLGEKRHELTTGESWKFGSSVAENWFMIVVGRGTHSAGQRGVIGPSVMKVLQEDGWKVEDEIALAGRVVVKGKSYKRK